MPARRKQTIFISHSSKDRQVTDELYQVLSRSHHLECWMDNYDLNAGEGAFPTQIVNALQGARVLALVDTPASRASDYVQREVQTARDLQIPVYHCPINIQQPAWRRKLQIEWLHLRIQMHLARGFISAAAILALLLVGMVAFLFLLGTQVAPVLAHADWRNLPAAFRSTPTPTAVPTPSDPKVAAPFHFKPVSVLWQEDFNDPAYENSLNEKMLGYTYKFNPGLVKSVQQTGSLVMDIPAICLDQKLYNDCRLTLASQTLESGNLQYFGLRARSLQSNYLRGTSVDLSISSPNSEQVGFGWYFIDQVMAYFYSLPELPEKDFTAFVPIDKGWHAYEILRDPQKATLSYYVDGQLVGGFTPVHGNEWNRAELQLTIASIRNKLDDPTGKMKTGTHFEIDELVVGGFN
jgi:hypothetical protein